MTLQQFGLTAEQILKRRDGIGGSDANIIMSGDDARILRLWEEKTGQAEPEDLSRVLPVQLGTWTEPLNRHWYTLQTGSEVSRAGETCQHPDHAFMRCSLDGFVEAEAAVFEAKHVNQFSKIDAVAQKYMPQLHHNMSVVGVSRAVLSVFVGTMTYEHLVVDADPFYTANLIEAEEYFWKCVTELTPPGEIKIDATPTTPALLRSVDMTGSNEWGFLAAGWLEHKAAAANFKNATKGLKSLVDFDVSDATGHGVKVTRAKNGSLTVRATK